MTTSFSGVLVVDLQPAYARPSAGSSISPHLMRHTLAHIAALPGDAPVTVLYVCEELSGDSLQDVHDFWMRHGADEALIDRIDWVEKPYGFLRGWMDNGVDEDDICAVLQELRRPGPLGFARLARVPAGRAGARRPCPGRPLLLRDEAVDALMGAMRRTSGTGTWATCGGGAGECLQEVELVLQSGGVPFERLHHLTY
jgi:hypothetical protein